MISSGYDCPLSIAGLDEEDIEIIQNHVANKASYLLKDHVIYSEQPSFELLPGHRKVLFTLKHKAIEFGERKNKSNSRAASEEVVLLTENELAKIKEKLINKLNTKGSPQIKVTFTELNIVTPIDPYISHNSRSFARGKVTKSAYRCDVKCCFCDKIIPCTFNKHWELGNIETHLKNKHLNVDSNINMNATLNETEINNMLNKA